jgi:(R,R)-butanediol dehydrogenase/meso-butanediol dehydrogenase/diacetyl reductase
MKIAKFHGIEDIRVEQVENRDPGPGEVQVKIKYCGICGSDVHEYVHGRFPISYFGHEGTGEIVAIGEGVDSIAIGDRVLTLGAGAYAEYLTTVVERVRKIKPSMSWERAAVMEPLAGTAYAMKRGGVSADDTILITGAGPIGLSFLSSAKAIGVKNIFMTEIVESRIQKARDMGATEVFNPLQGKLPPRIRELTGGDGVDVAIEAVGNPPSLKDCLASTRYRGTVIVHGIFTERATVHMLGFVTREVTMIGTNSIDMPQALEWAYSGKIQPEEIISSKIGLDDIVGAAFEKLTSTGSDEIKILVEP